MQKIIGLLGCSRGQNRAITACHLLEVFFSLLLVRDIQGKIVRKTYVGYIFGLTQLDFLDFGGSRYTG